MQLRGQISQVRIISQHKDRTTQTATKTRGNVCLLKKQADLKSEAEVLIVRQTPETTRIYHIMTHA